MTSERLRLALAVAVMSLGGCISATQYDAAGDIRAFLIAVRDGDQATFNQHVDRAALKTNLKARLLEEAGGANGEAAAALLAGPLVGVAVDALVRPQVFRAAAALAGYGPDTKIPGPLVIGHDLQALDQDRVCALIRKRCAFVFKREDDGVWRMIDFRGELGLLASHRRG
jgi:Protein of unknown function (DUF2939)